MSRLLPLHFTRLYIHMYIYVCMYAKVTSKVCLSCKIENVATKPFWIMISLYSSSKVCNSTVCRDCEKSPKLINVGPMYYLEEQNGFNKFNETTQKRFA